MSLRYFLPVYLLAYIIAAFFWRSYVVWKKTGVNPVVFKGDFSSGVTNFRARPVRAPSRAWLFLVQFVAVSPARRLGADRDR